PVIIEHLHAPRDSEPGRNLVPEPPQPNIGQMDAAAKTQIVKAAAKAVGFERVGVTSADPLPGIDHYKAWLANGHAGEMAYLQRNVSMRADPALLVPGAKSVVCVALNYRRPG